MSHTNDNIISARNHHKSKNRRRQEALDRRTIDLHNYEKVIERLKSMSNLRESDTQRLSLCSRKAIIAGNEVDNLTKKLYRGRQ